MYKVTTEFCQSLAARALILKANVHNVTGDRIISFRTNETNPIHHKPEQIGQFYTMSEDIKKRLFANGGLPKVFEEQTKAFTEMCVMIRSCSLDVINCLKCINYEKPIVRFVLYGKKGNGKTLTLAHLVHYGLQAGYLIVHVPWVPNWMRRCKETSNSETKEGFIDINLDAAAWLLHFKTQNAALLKNDDFKVSKDHEWSKRETTFKGAPLIELVEHGINRVKYASNVIVVLAEEIKLLSKKGVCKTLVAIDGFNAFFYPHTKIFNEKKEVIPPSKVTVTEAFLNLTHPDWNNAVAVVTVDELAMLDKDQNSHLPYYLLSWKGFKHLNPFIPIEVGPYTTKEFSSCLDYYKERKWLQERQGQEEELEFLSGHNPYKLMQLCSAL